MTFQFLDDRQFLDFNFSWLLDPTLRPGCGPTESELYALGQRSRQSAPGAAAEYQDTMDWTLRPAAFESFQKTLGVRPIEHRDWFYSKLFQFFRILLHDQFEVLGNEPHGDFGPPRTDRPWEEGRLFRGWGPSIDPDDLEAAFGVEGCSTDGWREFVELAAAAGGDRFEKVLALVCELARQRSRPAPPAKGTREWSDHAKRDQIILAGRAADRPRREICQELDQNLISPTPDMLAHGCGSWMVAWNATEFRRNIQSLFSKLWTRKAVKSRAVSGLLPGPRTPWR